MNLSRFKQIVFEHKLQIAEGGCLFITIIIIATATIIISHQRSTFTGPYRKEYSGKIIDKGTRFHESQTGSSMARFLIIEEKSGSRGQVYVSQDVYDRAEIGIWVQKNEKGVEIVPLRR